MPIQAKSDQIGVRSKERWGSTVGSEKVGGGAGVPEIRKCDARPTCRCARARARLAVPRWAAGTSVPGNLRGGSSVQPCAGVMQSSRRSTSNPIQRHSSLACISQSSPASRPIQQLTAAHSTPGKETQRGPTPQHGNQIRIHAVPQGGPLPVLPDLGAERSNQVSKPIRAPRGWSIGTSCSPPTTQPALAEVACMWVHEHVERLGANTTDLPGHSSRNPTRP